MAARCALRRGRPGDDPRRQAHGRARAGRRRWSSSSTPEGRSARPPRSPRRRRRQLDRRSPRRPRRHGPAHRARLRARSKRRGVGARRIDCPRADGVGSRSEGKEAARGADAGRGRRCSRLPAPRPRPRRRPPPAATSRTTTRRAAPSTSSRRARTASRAPPTSLDFLSQRHAAAAPVRPERHVRRPGLRDARPAGVADPRLLQGRELRRRARQRRADLRRPTAASSVPPSAEQRALRRRHDRPRPVRGPARLRAGPGGADVRPRLRHRRGPALPRRRPAPRRARRPLLLRRRRQRRPGPRHLLERPLHERRRAPAPVRPRRRPLRAEGRADPAGRHRTTSTG